MKISQKGFLYVCLSTLSLSTVASSWSCYSMGLHDVVLNKYQGHLSLYLEAKNLLFSFLVGKKGGGILRLCVWTLMIFWHYILKKMCYYCIPVRATTEKSRLYYIMFLDIQAWLVALIMCDYVSVTVIIFWHSEFSSYFRHNHTHGPNHSHSHTHGHSYPADAYGHSHNANMEGKFPFSILSLL